MKLNRIKNNLDLFEIFLTTIERGAKSGMSPDDINTKLKLIMEEYASYDNFSNIFNNFMPCTLKRYIKRRCLTEGYLKIQKTKRKLKSGESFHGINDFKGAFKNTFNSSLEDACAREYTAEDLEPPVQLDEILKTMTMLEESHVVSGLHIKKGGAEVEIDEENLLLLMLQMPVFFIQKQVYEMYLEGRTDKEKKLLLAYFKKLYKAALKKKSPDKIKLSFEEIEIAENINITIPYMCGDLYIYQTEMADTPGLRTAFERLVEGFIPFLKTEVPFALLPCTIAAELNIISSCSKLNTLSSILKKTEDEIIDLLWDYTQRGLLRIIPEEGHLIMKN